MSEPGEIDDLRQELIAQLDKPKLDYGRVLELSAELAKTDPSYVRFSIDAGHINRLGKELVAKKDTAVSELVKNAYDADATLATLTFEESEEPGGLLVIEDNGTGMTRRELIDGFMRLSSTEKVSQPISPIYKRMRAGRKGIGRFAAQRLGQKLTVVTQTEASDVAFRVTIDWTLFRGDVDLVSIANRIEEIVKTKSHGTILIIEDLADSWTDIEINRVYRYIVDLIQPFPLSEGTMTAEKDPGFQTEIYRVQAGNIEEVASVEKMVYEYALAGIEGYVDEEGFGIWSVNSHQLDVDEKAIAIGIGREDPVVPFKHLRNIYLRAYYYIYNANFLPRSQNKMIRDLANERGGIRVYRNGFRVLPYGEPYDDWLRLDLSSGRRLILPPHANLNFFGFVEIIDPSGETFEETASREGLIENDAFEELSDFVSRVLRSAVLKIAEARDRKRTASQKDWEKEQSPQTRITEAIKTLSQVATAFENKVEASDTALPVAVSEQIKVILRGAIRQIESAVVEEGEQKAALIEEIGMLRVLAGLGQAIGEFTHEVKQTLLSIAADVNSLCALVTVEETNIIGARLKQNMANFGAYAAYFDRAVSENARREVRPQELGGIVRAFESAVTPIAAKHQVYIQTDVHGYGLFTLPMHPSEWASILYNFFTNSVKAIRRANSTGMIYIIVGRDKSKVYLEFADNGDGIATEYIDRIFDAFFTTSSASSPITIGNEEVLGTGLGLKIVKDIVSSYNGDIKLVAPPDNYRTCFRVEVPSLSQKEREHYGY